MPSLDVHLAAARSNLDLMTYLRTHRLATDAGGLQSSHFIPPFM